MLLQPTGLAHPYHWDAFGDSGWGGRLAPTTATPLATVGGAGRLADWRLAPTTATPLATVGGAASQAATTATTTSWNQQAVSAVSLSALSLSVMLLVSVCVNMTYVLVQAPPGMPEPKRVPVPVPEPKYPPKRGQRGIVTVDKSPSYSPGQAGQEGDGAGTTCGPGVQ